MLTWLVRALLFLSGMIVGLFVAKEDLHYDVFQMIGALVLLVVVLAVAALWKRPDKTGGA